MPKNLCFGYQIELSSASSTVHWAGSITKVPFKIDIEKFPFIAFVNIHPSLLPHLKGRDPAIGLLMKGGELGITIHQMTMDIDSGFFLWQSNPIKVDIEMNIKDIYSLSYILEKKAGKELAYQIKSK